MNNAFCRFNSTLLYCMSAILKMWDFFLSYILPFRSLHMSNMTEWKREKKKGIKKKTCHLCKLWNDCSLLKRWTTYIGNSFFFFIWTYNFHKMRINLIKSTKNYFFVISFKSVSFGVLFFGCIKRWFFCLDFH